jgi:hypothetical protein
MRALLTAYVGRANVTDLTVQIDGETITAGVITRAQLRLGEHCIDTAEVGDPIELTQSATVVSVQLGLIAGLLPDERHIAQLTVYTATHTQGVAVETGTIITRAWPVCD